MSQLSMLDPSQWYSAGGGHTWLLYAALILGGILTGYINTLAGSGSLISLTLLSLLGIPIDVANGSNRLAIVMQSLVATNGLKQKIILPKDSHWISLVAIAAAIGGAMTASSVTPKVLETAVGIAMWAVFISLLFRPEAWLRTELAKGAESPNSWHMVLYGILGFYAGFIQIGIGLLLLTALVLIGGYTVIHANALKVGIILILAIASLLVFAFADLVLWEVGLILACGAMLGAWIGTRHALQKGERYMRLFLMVTTLLSGGYYLKIL